MSASDYDRKTGWIKAAASAQGGNCVQMRRLPSGYVEVRDSKHPKGSVLRFTQDEIKAFLDGVRAGNFDDLTR